MEQRRPSQFAVPPPRPHRPAALQTVPLVVFQDEDSEAVLAADFEIGHFIRERIVQRAVLYFTGEAIEDDDDDVSGSPASLRCTLLKYGFITVDLFCFSMMKREKKPTTR